MCKYLQFLFFAAVMACANAGLIGAPLATTYAAAPAYAAYGHAAVAPAAITSQSANILRSYGNLGQVSTYSKTIDTPYSSVTKSDVRVSNPGIVSVAPVGYALRTSPLAYARPFYVTQDPVVYAATPNVEPVSTVQQHVPKSTNDSESEERNSQKPKDREPLEPSGTIFTNNLQATGTKQVPHGTSTFLALHTPLRTYAPPSSYHVGPLIGIAYSSAPEVSHLAFVGAHGVHYAW